MKALGLNQDQAHRLFSVINWSSKNQEKFTEGKTNLARVKAAVAEIELFIEQNK